MTEHNIIIDLNKEISEHKDVIEQLNKLLLDSTTEKIILKEQIVLLERNSLYLEHILRVNNINAK